jgi:hypothetical protein
MAKLIVKAIHPEQEESPPIEKKKSSKQRRFERRLAERKARKAKAE